MAPSKHADEGGKLQLMENNRVQEEEECFDTTDKLISQRINAGDVKELEDADTCNVHTKKSLKENTGLPEAKVDNEFESQAPDESVMVASLEAVEAFLVKHTPDLETFWKKNYEQKPKQITETIEKRLGGYQKICMYGLGFVFWGAASSVLDRLDTNFVHWFAIYFTVSLVLMLGGLCAAMFPSSTPLALGTASLGAWKACVFILATFHIASLKFHQHVRHCVWSMIISTIVLTLHWGYSAQEPVFFHFISKIALRCVLFVLWVILICLKGVIKFCARVKSALGSLSYNCKQENPPLKDHLLRSNRGNNMRTWGWRSSTNV